MAGIQAAVAIVGGAFILFISVFTAAQGIRAKATADADESLEATDRLVEVRRVARELRGRAS